MEGIEVTKRQSVALPSISSLDEKFKRNDSVTTGAAFPPPPLTLAAGPANAAPAMPPGLISPPGTRRTSDDDKDPRQLPRQSLPSIHEALSGGDQSRGYPVQAPPPPPPQPGYYQPQQTNSPPDSGRRQFAPEAPPPPMNGFQPHNTSPYLQRSAPPPPPPAAATAGHSPPEPPLSRAPAAPTSNSRLPSLHPLQTTSPIDAPRYQYPQQPSPAYDAPPQSAQSVQPPFGYNSYQQHPLSAPPSSAAQNGFNSVAHTGPGRYAPQGWRPDGSDPNRLEDSRKSTRGPGPTYGESVKRHLESFDFEASLNEIADSSGRTSEFANHYRRIAHQTQRTGLAPASLPGMPEVDEMLQRTQHLHESLLRIRDVVLAQNASATDQAAQDQRYKVQNGYPPEEHNPYQDDTKSAGFAGADPKKRRGRAAPPGRCHSCNRAETPEWRRGPDGARTLCNACGLHYAKLTRKMGTNKAAVGGSNLRPKSPSA